nr:unnamed protein product [Callosobruchus analis]
MVVDSVPVWGPFVLRSITMGKSSTKKKKVETDRSRQLQRERSRESMKKLLEKIKNDPVLYEESKRRENERYLARKTAGKIKTIDQMSTREKRKIRKEWKARSKKTYENKKRQQQLERNLQENTPPASPIPFQPRVLTPDESQANLSRQAIKGKLIKRRNRESLKTEIKYLREQLRKKDRKLVKYKKKVQRMEKKLPDTPKKIVNNMLKGQQVPPEIKRSLVLSEVMQQQLKSKSSKENLFGALIKKYRFKSLLGSLTSRSLLLKNGDTCLCMVDDNMKLLMAKANTYNIIETKDPIQLSRQICCDETTEDCINRTCSICHNKTIKISNLEKDDKRTVKESVDCSKLDMVEHLNSSLVKFMAHSRNIMHQYNSVDQIKKRLTSEVLFHIDFSENYSCKYASEI